MNVTFMLVDLFGLRQHAPTGSEASPRKNMQTLKVLLAIESELGSIVIAFHEVYCVAYEMLDYEWLLQKASYLQFNGAT